MARKVVGLIGKGTGPKVFVGVPCKVELKGGSIGERVVIRRFFDDAEPLDHETQASETGVEVLFPIPCRFVQITYEGTSRSFVGNVHLEA